MNLKLGKITKWLFFISKPLLIVLVIDLLLLLPFFKSNYFLSLLHWFNLYNLVGVTILFILIIMFFWESIKIFIRKYKNSKQLLSQNFLLIEYIGLFIFFLLLSLSLIPVLVNFKTSQLLTLKPIFFINIINVLFLITWLIYRYHIGKTIISNNIKKNEKENELFDEPIQFIENDCLHRKYFVRNFAKEINTTSTTGGSFVFGLYGDWGEGKTSVINLLTKELKKDKNLLIIEFDPWYFDNEKAILSGFYGAIEETISKYFIFDNFKKLIRKYRDVIQFGFSKIGINVNSSIKEFTYESPAILKGRIEKCLVKTGKRILIVIDDIDRLQRKEIYYVLKLIRLNTNFSNLIFLVSADQNVMVKNGVTKQFLEKIIQKPIKLPKIFSSDLDNFVDSQFDWLFKALKISKQKIDDFKNDFGYKYQTQLKKYFTNLRIIKRFFNSFKTSLAPISNEVNLYDFFILEIIKIKYPKVYDDIWSEQQFYLPKWGNDFYTMSSLSFLDGRKRYDAIKFHIDTLIKKESASDKESIKELLQEIFFEVKNAYSRGTTMENLNDFRKKQRISHPECFKKYFWLKVPQGEMSDSDVLSVIKLLSSIKKEGNFFSIFRKLQIANKLLILFKKLLVFVEKLPMPTSELLVDAIIKNAEKLSEKGTENFWNSEFDSATRLVTWLINDKIPKEKIQYKLREVIKNISSYKMLFKIIHNCDKQEGGSFYNIYEQVNINELKSDTAKRMESDFLKKKNNNIFKYLPNDQDYIFVIAQWVRLNIKNKNKINEYLKRIITPKILAEIIDSYRNAEPQTNHDININVLSNIYDLKMLNDLARIYIDKKSLNSKQKDTITDFIKLEKNL